MSEQFPALQSEPEARPPTDVDLAAVARAVQDGDVPAAMEACGRYLKRRGRELAEQQQAFAADVARLADVHRRWNELQGTPEAPVRRPWYLTPVQG